MPETFLTYFPWTYTVMLLYRRNSRDLRPPGLKLTLQSPRSHSDSHIKRILGADRTRDILAHDIKCGAVRRRGDHHGQAALHSDAAVKAEQLHGDLPLVVVHGDDAVVAVSLQEDGVAGERALDRDSLLLGCLHRGPYVVDLVAPEVAALAVVWV